VSTSHAYHLFSCIITNHSTNNNNYPYPRASEAPTAVRAHASLGVNHDDGMMLEEGTLAIKERLNELEAEGAQITSVKQDNA
jgi:hypothetical protein